VELRVGFLSQKGAFSGYLDMKALLQRRLETKRPAATREGGVLQPGMVVLLDFLSEEEQERAARWSMERGKEGDDGWFRKDGSLNLESRGRIYRAIESFAESEWIVTVASRAVAAARELDETMPEMTTTHLLLQRYSPGAHLGWHRDNDPNDGDNDHPVVSLSLGCNGIFGFRNVRGEEKALRLKTGDFLLFGGPSRLVEHCVYEVSPHSCPQNLSEVLGGDCRVNFTFRDAPSVRGKEELFRTY
jgi:hypothetical protein